MDIWWIFGGWSMDGRWIFDGYLEEAWRRVGGGMEEIFDVPIVTYGGLVPPNVELRRGIF